MNTNMDQMENEKIEVPEIDSGVPTEENGFPDIPPRPDSVIIDRQNREGIEIEDSNPTVPPRPTVPPTIKTDPAIQNVILANNKPENYTRAAVEIKDANGNVRGHVTNFGSFNRYTKTDGSVEWYDSAGKKVDAPNSMKQQDKQKTLAEKKYDFDRLTLEQRNKRREEYNYAMADVAARATSQLRGGQGEVKQSKNGNYYRIVRFGNTDQAGPIKDANEKMTSMGRQSRLKSIIAAIRTDKDGNPLKGERVQLRMAVEPTGGVNAKSAVEIKNIDMGRAMLQYAKALETLKGATEDEARNATFNSFGGTDIYGSDNPLGWKLNEKKVTPEEVKREEIAQRAKEFESNMELEKKKIDIKNEQFDANMKETIRQFNATLDANQQKAISDAYTKSQDSYTKFIEALPKELTTSLFSSNVQMVGADGIPVTNADGTPVMKPLPAVEVIKRANALFDFAKVKTGGNVTPPTGENSASIKTKNQTDAEKEIEFRKKEKKTNGASEGESVIGSSNNPPTPTTPPSPGLNTQDEAVTLNSVSPDDLSGVKSLVELMNKNKGNAEKTSQPKPVKKSEQLEQIIARKKPADLWSEEVIMRFKRNHPEITDADIVSGKYDSNLNKISKALYGENYSSSANTLRGAIRDAKAEEERKFLNEREKRVQEEHYRMRKAANNAIAKKAMDLFGDLWKQADDYAIEHHGEDDWLFKDDYKTERAKKFAELVKAKVKKDKLQLYNVWKLNDNLFGSYDVKSVFDAVFGEGAGTYIGSARPKSGAENIFRL